MAISSSFLMVVGGLFVLLADLFLTSSDVSANLPLVMFFLLPVTALVNTVRMPLVLLPVAMWFAPQLVSPKFRNSKGKLFGIAFGISIVQIALYGALLPNKDDLVLILVASVIGLVEGSVVLFASSLIRRLTA